MHVKIPPDQKLSTIISPLLAVYTTVRIKFLVWENFHVHICLFFLSVSRRRSVSEPFPMGCQRMSKDDVSDKKGIQQGFIIS